MMGIETAQVGEATRPRVERHSSEADEAVVVKKLL
jgi:hypothetical protein